ncbi:hypothetical protein MZTS_07915 [Methylorubrum zatmanii]|nr:hypothetical protein [Methylorubrum zatmanii]
MMRADSASAMPARRASPSMRWRHARRLRRCDRGGSRGGRIALTRATTAFEAALQDLVTRAEARLRQLDWAVEQSLLLGLSAATSGIAWKEPDAVPVEVGPLGDTKDNTALSEALALVIATDTGRIVISPQDLSAGLPLQFPDGAVPVRVEPFTSTAH